MTTELTGGPAFPHFDPVDGSEWGMTLRDYFATRAMQAMLSQRAFPYDALIPKHAYQIADDMLKARSNGL